MRQPPNGKRSRNRPGRGNRQQHSRNHTFDSSGPEGKVRGTANQVYEKYLALARDASSSGDRIMAENFFQHAEHYFRLMAASGQQMRPRTNGFDDAADDEAAEGENDIAVGQPGQPQPRVEAQAQPAAKPETPAELAQAAAANEGDSSGGNGGVRRGRGRRPPRSNSEAAADA